MNIQRPMRFFTVICLVAILASCASFQPAEKELPPLRVEYTYWWGDFTILVAQELGLFEKYNVDVEPVYYDVFSEALPALATGAVDGGLFAPDDVLSTNDSSPVKVVAVYDDGGTNYVIGAPEIKSPADLKGKLVGVNIGTFGELFIARTLAEAGLTTRDVTLIDTAVENVPAQLGNTIDAGYAWDPFASDAISNGANLLYKSGSQNSITPDLIVFRSDVAGQRPDDIRAFLKAWFEAVEYRLTNPEEANQIIAREMGIAPEELSEDAQLFTSDVNKQLFSGEAMAGRIGPAEVLTENADFLIRLGTLSKKPILSEILDPSYLP
jgi:NitT/TauT family transport system substrate-binding protein